MARCNNVCVGRVSFSLQRMYFSHSTLLFIVQWKQNSRRRFKSSASKVRISSRPRYRWSEWFTALSPVHSGSALFGEHFRQLGSGHSTRMLVSETSCRHRVNSSRDFRRNWIINPDNPEEMTIVPDPESEADIEMSAGWINGWNLSATSSLEHQQSGSAMIDTAQLLIEDPVALGRRADAVLDEIFKMHKVIRKYRPSAILCAL